MELTCRDGVIMRKDSSRTRFSTAISFIEAHRISTDIVGQQSENSVSMQPFGSTMSVSEAIEINAAINNRNNPSSNDAPHGGKISSYWLNIIIIVI